MSYKDKNKNRAYAKAWYHNNKDKLDLNQRRESVRRWRQEKPKSVMLVAARARAKRLGYDFNIDLSDIIIPEMCPILGIPIKKTPGRQTDNTPSLDRIDNSLGYVKGNVAVISHKANRHKADLSVFDVQRLWRYVFL